MYTKEQLYTFISKQKTVFVASVDKHGFPNLKAMFSPRKVEGNCFFLTTNTSSMRTQQFLANPKASLYFYNRGRFHYEGLMLIGTMEVLTDAAIKEEIWKTGDIMYYRKGVTDPDYCVFKFTAQEGRRYYDLSTESFLWDQLA